MSEPESYMDYISIVFDFVAMKMNNSSLFNADPHVVSMLHVVSIHNLFFYVYTLKLNLILI